MWRKGNSPTLLVGLVCKLVQTLWKIYGGSLENIIEYYSAIKKNEIKQFAATWMDLEVIILSEVSQTETDMIAPVCETQNILKMNLFTKLK